MLTHRAPGRIVGLPMSGNLAAVAVLAFSAAAAATVAAAPVAARAAAVRDGRIYYSVGALLPDPDLKASSQVWSVKPDGTDIRQLTHVPAPAQAGGPDVSPNGKLVLYVSNAAGPFQVWVMRADGGGQHRVVNDPQHDAFVPRWSPDGSHLLFTRCSSPFGFTECSIATVGLDGRGLHDLTRGHWLDFSAAYSPNGRTIALSGDRGGYVSAMYRMPAAGGRLHRLAPVAQEAFWPDFSPDGRQLIFGDNADRPLTNLWTMRPDGSHPRQITHFTAANQNSGFARYSPDGRHVVADFNDGTTDWLVTMNIDGSNLTKVVKNGGTDALTLADWAVSS